MSSGGVDLMDFDFFDFWNFGFFLGFWEFLRIEIDYKGEMEMSLRALDSKI